MFFENHMGHFQAALNATVNRILQAVKFLSTVCTCILSVCDLACRTGEAKITKGYKLAARCIIHTVGPRYNAKYRTAAESALFNCYRNILLLLRYRQMRHVNC